MKKNVIPRSIFVLFVAATTLFALTGCAAEAPAYPLAALEGMPAGVRSSPVLVQQAYRFAVANPQVLQQIPCYCGCGNMGHTSNYACYVSGQDANGEISFDTHAMGCSICVDITQDVMRLLSQGQSIPQILAYVDTAYSQYGPSNIP